MHKKTAITLLILAIMIAAVIFLLQWRAGQAVLEVGENEYDVGDNLVETFSLTIKAGTTINKDAPILLTLTKSDNVAAVTTFTLEDLIKSSDLSPPSLKDNKYYFSTSNTYIVNSDQFLSYKFTEADTYELLFNVLSLDLTLKRTIIVK